MSARDFGPRPRLVDGPLPVKTAHGLGSAMARGLLRLFGWRLRYDGLPGLQGVIMVYPHTSNWDFVIGILAKWAFGLKVRFWAKDSLFKVPVFGGWVRAIGGIAVNRSSSHGLVGGTVEQLDAARARGELFWLAAAPEGTRSLASGWRSGAYQVALQARVPVGLAYFDFAEKVIGLHCFVSLGGDPQADLALMAEHLAPRRGQKPELASPIRLRS